MRHKEDLPLVIDLIGMQGCGKTTVLKNICPELRRRGYRCPTLDEIETWRTQDIIGGKKPGALDRVIRSMKWRFVTCFFLQPRVSISLFIYSLTVRPINRMSWKAAIYLTRALNCVERRRNSDYDLILIDEFGHNWLFVIQMYGASFSMSHLKRAAAMCVRRSPRLVFFIDVDPALSLHRIRQRANVTTGFPMPGGRYDSLSEDAALEMNRRRHYVFAGIVDGVRSQAPSDFVRIDGRLSPDEISKNILTVIVSRLNCRSRSSSIVEGEQR